LTLNHSGARYPKYNHDWIIIHFEVDDGSGLSSSPTIPATYLLYMLNNKRERGKGHLKRCAH
jgi:hypothetical protein